MENQDDFADMFEQPLQAGQPQAFAASPQHPQQQPPAASPQYPQQQQFAPAPQQQAQPQPFAASSQYPQPPQPFAAPPQYPQQQPAPAFAEAPQLQPSAISTEALQLVIREDVAEVNRFLGRKVASRVGYDLAIFRQGACTGWIDANSFTTTTELERAYRARVKNGDVIFAIKNGPWSLVIGGTLKTSEGHSREYILNVTFSIVNTRDFIEQYVQYSNQHNDPVEQATRAIKGYLRLIMGNIPHNDMADQDLINAAQDALKYEKNASFGLEVLDVKIEAFEVDPHIKALYAIQQQTEKASLQAQGEGKVNEIRVRSETKTEIIRKEGEIARLRLDGDVQREQQKKNAENDAEIERQKMQDLINNLALQNQIAEARQADEERKALHEGTIARIKAGNQANVQVTEVRNELIRDLSRLRQTYTENIRNAIENDEQGIEEALKGSGMLELMTTLERLSNPGGYSAPPALPAIAVASAETVPASPGFAEQASGEWPAQSSGPLPGIIKQDTHEDPVLFISDLGLKLMRTTLGEGQRQLTGLGQDTAFLICSCAAHSPAEQAHLQVGDVLVWLNAIPLATQEDLSRAVSSGKSGQELPFTVLRDRALVSGTVKLPR